MPIDFDAVLNSEKARDSLFCVWYKDVLQEEAKEISDALPFGRLWYGEANASSETEKIRACIINPSPYKIVA
jgi:hypothetical protein